jgi:class 3 adenylate cyclase
MHPAFVYSARGVADAVDRAQNRRGSTPRVCYAWHNWLWGRFDFAAIGTVSNIASRLCDEATSDRILISPRVLIAVEDAITVEPVGEFALKGIRRPMTAYNVVASKSAN